MKNGDKMQDLMAYMKQQLNLKKSDLKTYSPLVLAYIGDGFYELIIRTMLVSQGNAPVQRLHKRASELVKAKTQAVMMKAIEPLLTEEEISVYKRGRNSKSATNPKNVSVVEYRIATGFEALLGYLYLKEDYERAIDLVQKSIEIKDKGY